MHARATNPRVVVVTGAARGLGLAVAQRFLRDGCRVACLDCNASNLRQAIDQMRPSRNLLSLVTDVSKPKQVRESFSRIIAQCGRIDVLANIAGIAEERSFLNCPLKTWRRILDVNVTGMFLVAQTAAQQM